MHVLWGLKRQNIVFTVGKSIFNRSSDIMIGELMLQYGGGDANAGTCQVSNEDAERVQQELIDQITRSAVTV
jgi:nanoRNase/pAp phosphatase (c-di-AMP/oligoRNAs hydrolase)